MARIEGELDLSNIPEDEFKLEQELKVAVTREGRVLGSTVLNPAKLEGRRLPFAVDFEPPILPGSSRPCPVTLIVGPNVADRDLFGLETLKQVVELEESQPLPKPKRGQKEAAQKQVKELTIKLEPLVVDRQLYLCWLVCCKTYTIRGRVVCRHWEWDPILHKWRWCDEPVPGATVSIYDVDKFLWWSSRDLIGTAVTATDGSFTFTFNWCCLRLFPWLDRHWMLDPDLLHRIQELLAAANLPIPPIPPGPDPDPVIFQEILGSAARLPGQTLSAAATQEAALPQASVLGAPLSAEALMDVLPASPELQALHVWPWWTNWGDCAPDIVFQVTQPCNGVVNTIYSESNAQARWDIPTSLNVTLLANDKACCIPTCRDPECPECLKLTWVHCVPTDQIGVTAGPPDLRGYSYTATKQDRPFYGALRIRGAVGWDVDYFKVQYSFNGGAWSDLPIPAFGGFSRSYWDGTSFVPVVGDFSPALKNGQTVILTRRHWEDTHPAIPRYGGAVIWNDFDTLFFFRTLANQAITPDGLYQFRFVGYAADAADNLILTSERILPTCGQQTDEMVYIRVDNQGSNHPVPTPQHPCTIIHKCTNEPDAFIRKVCKNEGMVDEVCIDACDIVRLEPDDTLTIHFTVTCPMTVEDGHLEAYWMRFEYGVSQSFYVGTGLHGTFSADPTTIVGPNYADALAHGAPRPHWYGGDYKVTVRGADFPECCAYLLRLWAWKRTSNGCNIPSLTHWNQFELTFTVLRPDLCPDVCPQE